MTDDSARKAILARRARFIAAAMMGAGLASCDRTSTEPSVCLGIPQPQPDTAPTPCLTVAVPPSIPPEGTGATTGPGAPGEGGLDAGAGPSPRVCLSRAPPRPCLKPPPPQVCLTY